MSARRSTFQGILWTGAANLASTAINFVTIAILARILSPSDFGLMGMFLVIMNLAGMISDLGLGMAAIQRQELSSTQLSTFFYLNVLLGLLLGGMMYSLAFPISFFFQQTGLKALIELGSPVLVIVASGATFRTLLQKEMKFKELALIEVFGTVVYGTVSVALSFRQLGVFSLLVGFGARQFLEFVMFWWAVRYKPQLLFRLQDIRQMITFGLYVLGERILNYCNRNLDNILVGRFLGAEALGYYAMAYQLMFSTTSRISQVIGKVTYPAFSKIQNENEKMRRGYLTTVKYVSLVVFPLMAVLVILAPEFIVTVYGNKWTPSVIVLQIFCLLGAVESIGSTVGSVIYAKGHPNIAFKYNVINVIFATSAILVGLPYGIVGVAVSLSAVSLLLGFMWHRKTNALMNLSWKSFFTAMQFSALTAAILLGMTYVVKVTLMPSFSITGDATMLLVTGSCAVLTYLATVFLSRKSLFTELHGLPLFHDQIKSSARKIV